MDPAKWEDIKVHISRMFDHISADCTGMSLSWEDDSDLYWANFQVGVNGKDCWQVNFGTSEKSKVQPLQPIATVSARALGASG